METDYKHEENLGSLNIYFPPTQDVTEAKTWINMFGEVNGKISGEGNGQPLTFINYTNQREKLHVETIIEKDIKDFILQIDNYNLEGENPDDGRVKEILKNIQNAYNLGAKINLVFSAKNDAEARSLMQKYGQPTRSRIDIQKIPKTLWVIDLPDIGARITTIVR